MPINTLLSLSRYFAFPKVFFIVLSYNQRSILDLSTMSNPRRPPFGYDCPNPNDQRPAARQQPQRLGGSQPRTTQRPIPGPPIAPNRSTQSTPSSSRPRPQQPATTRNVRIATFSDIGGLGGEQEQQGPGFFMGGQGDVAVGDRGVGDYRRWVAAEPQAEPAQPLGNFSSTGRTLDGRTVTTQTQESTTSFGEGSGGTNRRPGGRSSSNAATQQDQNANNHDRRAAGAPSTGLDAQRTITGPFCTVTLGCGRSCPGTWSHNGEPFNHGGSAEGHFVAGVLTLFSNSPNAFSVHFTMGVRSSDIETRNSLWDLTDRQLLILRAVCMRRCLKRDLQNHQCHPHIQKFYDEGWLSLGLANHFDQMMKRQLSQVNRILGFSVEEWVGTHPNMPIPDPMKVDAQARTMRRARRPEFSELYPGSTEERRRRRADAVAFLEGKEYWSDRIKEYKRDGPFPEDRYHQVGYTP